MGFPANFDAPNLPGVSARLDSIGESLQTGRKAGNLRVVHLTLPSNVQVQINRWTEPAEGNYINAKITMSAQPNQDGHCGNFNGNPTDDARMQVRARIGVTGVPAGPEFLFPGGKTPISPGNRPDLNDCPQAISMKAKKICDDAGQTGTACMVDICFGGGAVR